MTDDRIAMLLLLAGKCLQGTTWEIAEQINFLCYEFLLSQHWTFRFQRFESTSSIKFMIEGKTLLSCPHRLAIARFLTSYVSGNGRRQRIAAL